MSDITIPKSEYDSLLTAKSENESLKKQVDKLQEESGNKSTGIKERDDKLKTQKEKYETQISEKDEHLKQVREKLGLSEEDNLTSKLDELSGNNTKYNEMLEKEAQERTERIEAHKKILGEDFLKEKNHLLEGLDDEKQENLLKEFVTLTGKEETSPGIKVGIHTDGGNGTDVGKQSEFDKLVATGANSSELLGEIAKNV